MDPSIIVALIALVGAIGAAWIAARKDRVQIEKTAYAKNTTVAIDGLQAAFEAQKVLTHDCQNECARLRAELNEARTDLTIANGNLVAALREIHELEAVIRGKT